MMEANEAMKADLIEQLRGDAASSREGYQAVVYVRTLTEAADELTALRERVTVLTAAVERARRHAQNIGITDGSYIAQLDAALSAAIGEDIGGGRG